jgi:hypothetical protein
MAREASSPDSRSIQLSALKAIDRCRPVMMAASLSSLE